MHLALLAVVAVVATTLPLTAPPPPVAADPHYMEIIDIPLIASHVVGMDDAGRVVGRVRMDDLSIRMAVWDPNSSSPPAVLGFGGADSTTVYRVSHEGVVVGRGWGAVSGPMVWYPTSYDQPDLLDAGTHTSIYQMWGPSRSGQILGLRAYDSSVDANAVIWAGPTASPVLITVLATVAAMGPDGRLFGMRPGSPAVWALTDENGSNPVEIPDFDGRFIGVGAMAAGGKIVGSVGSQGSFVLMDGVVTMTAPNSVKDINDEGFTVGQSIIQEAPWTEAAMWDPQGNRTVLDDLLPPGSNLQLIDAVAINNSCEVVARARGETGSERFVLLRLPSCALDTLEVELSVPPGEVKVGVPVAVNARITTSGQTPVDVLLVGDLEVDPDQLDVESGPVPEPPQSMGPNNAVNMSFTVVPKQSGRLPVELTVQAMRGGNPVVVSGSTSVWVKPALRVEIDTTVSSGTKVGDEFDVIVVVTNDEDDVPISGIRPDGLWIEPSEAASYVSGPRDPGGQDPRIGDGVTLEPGESTTFTWTHRAEQSTEATIETVVFGRDPNTGTPMPFDAMTTVPIAAPGMTITNLRLQPERPMPGDFATIRGTLVNSGTDDITGIDFEIESNVNIEVFEVTLFDLDPEVSPRIDLLEADADQDFVIPVHVDADIDMESGPTPRIDIDLTFTGSVEVGDSIVDVTTTRTTFGVFDLSDYYTNLLADYIRLQREGFWRLVEGINDWGDSSLLGNVAVGGSSGVANAFARMGQAALDINDLIGNASGLGSDYLSAEAHAMTAAIREYYHTTSLKQMANDLGGVTGTVTVTVVDGFVGWMNDLDTAYTTGDYRTVTEMLAEPGTELAAGVLTGAGTGQLMHSVINRSPTLRRMADRFTKSSRNDPDTLDPDTRRNREVQELQDLPIGTRMTGQMVAKAGLTVDEHAWMIEMAKKHGVAFFVRPRPEQAARWARMGYNAKPMAIKTKAINDIDVKWLGYDDFADRRGLLALREPQNPTDRIRRAVDSGELKPDDPAIGRVLERYNARRAEWESRSELLKYVDTEFEIQRYGQTIRTKITLDSDGLMRFSHNGQPVYSDIDLLHIARPNGDQVPPQLVDRLLKEAGFGFDSQHGATMNSSDFANWEQAKRFMAEYATEHSVGGTPLIAVQPDVTTLAYVDKFSFPDVLPPGASPINQATVSYVGAGHNP